MARSCTELLEPARYADAPNFLIATSRLCMPEDDPGDSVVDGCGLIDLSGTRASGAAVAVQAAALMEGRTNTLYLPRSTAMDDAVHTARVAGATTFDCVVALPAGGLASVGPPRAKRLPGAWVAVCQDAVIPRDAFDLVVHSRGNVTADAARVFRMIVSLLTKETVTCMDLEDFLHPLRAGKICRVLAGAVREDSETVEFSSPDDAECLHKASGVVIVYPYRPGRDTLRGSKRIMDSVLDQAPLGASRGFHWPVGQHSDALGGPWRPVDVLVASS